MAFALTGAAQAVALVQSGTALPRALTQIFAEYTNQPNARGAIQDLAYRTMRQLGRAETLLTLLTEKPVAPAVLHGLLCCALALLVEPEQNGRRPYEDFTVVDQAVTACAAGPLTARAKGMVNAVLRRFLRERTTLLLKTDAIPLAQWNYPSWWIDSMRAAWPRDWKQILETGNQPAPLTLRVNRRRTSVADYLQQLASLGIAATQIGSDAVR
ncbi:MAG: transcription antitermination factor NusB, partial [Burkholderiaceae bacterium]